MLGEERERQTEGIGASSRACTGASVSLVSGKIKMGGFQNSRFAKEKGKMVGTGHFSKQGIFSRIYLANYPFFSRCLDLIVRLPVLARHNLPLTFQTNGTNRQGGDRESKKVLKEKKRCLHGKGRVFFCLRNGGEAAAVSPR